MKPFRPLISRLMQRRVVSIKADQPSQTRAALETSVALLREIGEISAQVPYIKGAAGVLLRIILIGDTLGMYKNQCDELECNMLPLVKVLLEATAYAKDHSWIIPPDLHHILKLWPQELEKIEDALRQHNNQMKTWRRFYPLLNHESAMKRIKYCSGRIKNLADNYQASLLLNMQANDPQPQVTIYRANINLPACRSTFHGHDSHLTAILELFKNADKLPVRTAILGPGGIGKTTLALAVLHHPIVMQSFNERIYFISCEGCLSTPILVNEIEKVLGIKNELDSSMKEQNILSYLEESSSSHNKQTPLSSETSQKFFKHISNKWDDWAEKLVHAVEGLPLALSIIAHLAQSQECEVLWQQWKKIDIRIIERGKGHRLTSLETSIELSLQGHHLKTHPAASFLLSLLGMLPGGLSLERLDQFQSLFTSVQSMKESASALLKSGLAYSSFDILHVHPLIYYYSQEHLPLSVEHVQLLEKYYIDLTLKDKALVKAIALYSWLVSRETGSFISELFELLEQKKDFLQPGCIVKYQIQWGISLQHCGKHSEAHTTFLKALEYAKTQDNEIYQADILKYLGQYHNVRSEYELARSSWKLAIDLYEKNHDIQVLVIPGYIWVKPIDWKPIYMRHENVSLWL
ncbi:hypothetical protein FA95DRAFT_1599434 [Auriscalpium vulgare]|uniref:Uncharacterized protein n=1 Tax=Auriscalpium vulgare TaxID=40419 RepID=A0ACB8R8I0_9AGAM|nr:hypothetical protein FA95DRAFT_1599434 [Auriscalpium vulgare]